MNRTTWFIALAMLALSGCTPRETATPAAPGPGGAGEERLQIAVIPKGSTHEFWKSVRAGAEEAGAELGVEIIWKGPMREDDREDQIKVVEDFTTRRVDGIVLAPLDDTALRLPVDNAQQAGIPVVIIDSGLKDVRTVSFVATDNMEGGRKAGKRLGERVADGSVVMLRYQIGSASTMERESGFMEAIGGFPGVKVASENQYGGATTETAQKASENLLARFKNPDGTLGIQGIFTPNESTTFGMLRVLQDMGLAGKVTFVGFDASPKLVEALVNGEIDALVLQNPRKMGYLGVKTMVAHLRGEQVEERIDTGATLVTKDNMNDPDIAPLLAPPSP